MKSAHLTIGNLIVMLCLYPGCKTRSGHSQLRDTGGPVTARNAWLQSPEAIEGTITKTWGIPMSPADRWRYIRSTYSFLGGTDVSSFRSGIDQPNSVFALSISSLSSFVAKQMVERQQSLEGRGELYIFDGLGLAEPNEACFQNAAISWCDAQDQIRVNSLSSASLKVSDLNLEWRKRIMHNIQDLGEFLLVDTDNVLIIPDGTDRHAAQYLYEEVFLARLGEGVITADNEKKAWQDVLFTILVGGGYFTGITPSKSSPPTVASFNAGDKAVAIPDATAGAPGILKLELKPTKTDAGLIKKLQLKAFLTHPQRGQLRIDLSRGSKTVTVYQGATDPMRNFEDLELSLDSETQNLLKTFIDQPSGPWIATIYDSKPFEKGSVDSFILTVEYGS